MSSSGADDSDNESPVSVSAASSIHKHTKSDPAAEPEPEPEPLDVSLLYFKQATCSGPTDEEECVEGADILVPAVAVNKYFIARFDGYASTEVCKLFIQLIPGDVFITAPADAIQTPKTSYSSSDQPGIQGYPHDESSEYACITQTNLMADYLSFAREDHLIEIPTGRRRLTGQFLFVNFNEDDPNSQVDQSKGGIKPVPWDVMCQARAVLGIRPVSWVGGQMQWNDRVYDESEQLFAGVAQEMRKYYCEHLERVAQDMKFANRPALTVFSLNALLSNRRDFNEAGTGAVSGGGGSLRDVLPVAALWFLVFEYFE